ncbi:MAG: hypothetical protein ABIG95_02945 [Candidatus Woesearchaeota archaeon]
MAALDSEMQMVASLERRLRSVVIIEPEVGHSEEPDIPPWDGTAGDRYLGKGYWKPTWVVDRRAVTAPDCTARNAAYDALRQVVWTTTWHSVQYRALHALGIPRIILNCTARGWARTLHSMVENGASPEYALDEKELYTLMHPRLARLRGLASIVGSD